MQRLLFVDDDVKYQFVIKNLLEVSGYIVDVSEDVASGLHLFNQNNYDLVITDFKMEQINGLQFLELLRKKNENIKVIMLTGVNSDEAELRGLELSVNDYIKKPIGFEVLLKRIQLVLKQGKVFTKNEIRSESAGIIMNLNQRLVKKNEEFINLTTTEFNFLMFLLENKNIVFSREEILQNVWREIKYVDIRTVDTHVKKIRQKLKVSNIYSIRGVGYEWVE